MAVTDGQERSPDHNPGNRATDQGFLHWLNCNFSFDRLIIFVAVTLVLISVYRAESATSKAGKAANDARTAVQATNEGRRIALAANCALASGTINAGVLAFLAAGHIHPPKLEKNLEKLGLPPREPREAASALGAESYAAAISSRVEAFAGVSHLIQIQRSKSKNGHPGQITGVTVDCDKLRRASFITKPIPNPKPVPPPKTSP